MTYFVTGATGFIGRHLVERLLEREGDIHVLVRPESEGKLERRMEGWARFGDTSRIKVVHGDLAEPSLGVPEEARGALKGQVDHFFHLAAIYDMEADETRNALLNVGGTQNAVDLANALGAGIFHHVSSIAAAGMFEGHFTEDMFDEGQKLTHPYHRTKFESEKIARERIQGAWRVYRPAIVVGHSETGEMDKIDGPYYFFKAIQKARAAIPQWFPLVGIEVGKTNIVPVDYVAAALDHIAHQPGLDGQAFHLVNPKKQRAGDVINAFARAGHAPQMAMRIDKKLTDMLPTGVLGYAMKLPQLKQIRRTVLADFGIPDTIIEYMGLTATFDARDTQRALQGSGIELPELEDYAWKLWDYWERHLDPDLFKDHSFEGAVNGKTVVITGASSGIGRAAALKIAAAGGIPLLVARGQEKLDETKAEIEAAGGTAYAYSADLASLEAIDDLVQRIMADHPAVDYLVNNAGRSIRRSIELSYDRFHDFERTIQLNYLGTIKLIMGLLPHMREAKRGHIVNVSSIGVQTSPPRFSAYVASKSALDAWTNCVSSETVGDNVTFTTIHMPLVRTPMIAPTKIYDSFPTISPDEAGDIVCEAIRAKPKQINTRLGTFGQVASALAPKAVDQILHMAYRVFPDSSASKGSKNGDERASGEMVALAHLMRGVHW
ncbi:MAG: 3-oxoacyl-[acyl-carrier protein] reductase [uncultured Solirubrobacteraceae bacterium]|uniref:3-oxoacyl-[acyl-carrier protein] reductase n=1 Tax=uncultured Solirubrobacteraceae bacterium TaxID=1162706 RepID=A0A6J4RWT0_9ACTN|nr:MAG: 3-oxoacyl-[acyl-carrier protein] reductase [uncultured Solirubrobacteraceae bacterium]